MKLSKAQEEVLEELKADIDLARKLDYPEWLRATTHHYRVSAHDDEKTKAYIEERFREAVARGYLKEYWEMNRNGIALVHCNTRTLKKLEALGLIEIEYDSTGEDYGIDSVKVINY